MNAPIRVLLIEDEPGDAFLIMETLSTADSGGDLPYFDVEHVDRLQAALPHLESGHVDVVLSDLNLPDSKPEATVAALQDYMPLIPVVVVTSREDARLAQESIREGAQDYLYKDEVSSSVLSRALRYAIERQRIHQALERRVAERTADMQQANAERRRTEASLRRRNRELSLFNRVGRTLGSTLDLDEVLEALLEEVRSLLDVVASSVWLIDPETQTVACRHATGPQSGRVRGWQLAPGQGLVGRVVQSGQSLIVPDAQADPRHFNGIDQETGLSLRSILTVPLQVKDTIVGALQVLDTDAGRFTPHDSALLEALAVSAAIAVENARLYHEAQQEIAERKRAEAERGAALEALRESEARFDLFMRHLPAAVAIKDTNQEVIYANERFAEIAGREVTEIIGTTTESLLPEELHAQYQRENQRVLRGETIVSESSAPGPKGMTHWITYKFPIYRKGVPAFIGSVSLEMTERKRAEQALHESEERFRILFDNLKDGVFLHPVLPGNEPGPFEQVNEAACTMLGYTAEELSQMTPWDLDDPEVRSIYIPKAMQRLRDQGQAVFEAVQITKDGRRIPVEVKANVFELQGETRIISVVRDITERKEAEEILARYAADLERSNRELEQFGYVVSHDLRAPLRTVKNYLRLLHDRYGDDLDAKANAYIDYAVGRADRMKAMIQALLDLSRIETQGRDLAPTNVAAIVDDALQTLAPTIAETGAAVTRDPLPTVMADEDQLTQVFQNLVANALKFRREGVPVRVHISATTSPSTSSPAGGPEGGSNAAEKPTASLTRPSPSSSSCRWGEDRTGEGEWVFSVADNGIGIDPDQTDVLFQIFQRLHTEEEYEGLGIGLALCKRIIERHGGRIWVESAPGEGATFYFTLSMA